VSGKFAHLLCQFAAASCKFSGLAVCDHIGSDAVGHLRRVEEG
jgi:hypothetical protein